MGREPGRDAGNERGFVPRAVAVRDGRGRGGRGEMAQRAGQELPAGAFDEFGGGRIRVEGGEQPGGDGSGERLHGCGGAGAWALLLPGGAGRVRSSGAKERKKPSGKEVGLTWAAMETNMAKMGEAAGPER